MDEDMSRRGLPGEDFEYKSPEELRERCGRNEGEPGTVRSRGFISHLLYLKQSVTHLPSLRVVCT